jgi:CheY-like chemotaxis protein
MASLTRQLLAFARQQVLSPETLDLNGAIQDTCPMLQRLIGSGTPIELVLGPGPKWVRMDRAQLVQVLLNLVINARDAMPGGGRIELRTETLEVSPHHVFDKGKAPLEPGAYALVAIRDTGQGIPAHHLPHIFEPFYTTKEVGLGTGLGLATVEGVVSQSGGHIQVESEVGQGTTIKILLPLTTEPAPPAIAGMPTPRQARSRGRILVVDDEDAVRMVVTRTLQAGGYEVFGAREGAEALRMLEEIGGAIDVLITDLVMPGMGGAELVEEIAQRQSDLPIIWMSGHPREGDIPRDRHDRIQPFLMKPVAPDALLDTVARVLTGAVNGTT